MSWGLGPELYRVEAEYEKLAVSLDTAAFACVGWCLAVACLAVARPLAAAVRTDTTGAVGVRDRQAGQIYAFAAVVGLAVANGHLRKATTRLRNPTLYADRVFEWN